MAKQAQTIQRAQQHNCFTLVRNFDIATIAAYSQASWCKHSTNAASRSVRRHIAAYYANCSLLLTLSRITRQPMR